jgi:hypothetical protein
MGAYKYEWSWEGIDGSGSTQSHSNQRGPNLLGAQLLMTFNSEDFTYISTESQTSLASLEEILEELETNIFEEVFEEIAFEEEISFEMAMEEIEEVEEIIETMSFEPSMTIVEETIEETTFEEVVEEPMEEIYEETQEITSSFLPMVSEEEEVVAEEEESVSGSVSMEPAEEEVEEETVEEEVVEEEPTEMVEAEDEETFEEEAQEEESPSETATESTVPSKKTAKQKKIQQEKAIVKNIERIMDKVDSDVKDIAKNLQIKNIIKLDAMASEQASLDLYRNAVFYRPKDIYLDQLNIFDQRQIYNNVNLATYIDNDKITIRARALEKLKLEKRRLQIELEQLKNG